MTDHYMLPGEFAQLLVTLFLPAAVVAFSVLWFVWLRSRPRHPVRRLLAVCALVAIVGTALSLTVLVADLQALSFLRVRDLWISGTVIPVHSGAFASFACTAIASLWWLRRASV
jgi:ABC-type Fe3+-siderophore transport system permease subunit